MQEKLKLNQMWFNVTDEKTVYVITKIHKADESITNASCRIFKKIKDGNWFNTKEDSLIVFSIDYIYWKKIDL